MHTAHASAAHPRSTAAGQAQAGAPPEGSPAASLTALGSRVSPGAPRHPALLPAMRSGWPSGGLACRTCLLGSQKGTDHPPRGWPCLEYPQKGAAKECTPCGTLKQEMGWKAGWGQSTRHQQKTWPPRLRPGSPGVGPWLQQALCALCLHWPWLGLGSWQVLGSASPQGSGQLTGGWAGAGLRPLGGAGSRKAASLLIHLEGGLGPHRKTQQDILWGLRPPSWSSQGRHVHVGPTQTSSSKRVTGAAWCRCLCTGAGQAGSAGGWQESSHGAGPLPPSLLPQSPHSGFRPSSSPEASYRWSRSL